MSYKISCISKNEKHTKCLRERQTKNFDLLHLHNHSPEVKAEEKTEGNWFEMTCFLSPKAMPLRGFISGAYSTIIQAHGLLFSISNTSVHNE